MRLKHSPAAQGLAWVREGFRLFARQPMAYVGMFAMFLFGIFVLMLLPWVGPAIVLVALPTIPLAFMLATQDVVAGRRPTPECFIRPLRSERPQRMALLKLGVVYAVASAAIMLLSDWADGGALDALVETMTKPGATPDDLAARLSDPSLALGLLVRLGSMSLLSIPFWHAPALVYWDKQGAAQSLFSSTVACWTNRGAFAVYALVWVALVLAWAITANIVLSALGATAWLSMLVKAATLIFSTVFYASLYPCFLGCFDTIVPPVDGAAPQAPEGT